jgi:hypothetical protein
MIETILRLGSDLVIFLGILCALYGPALADSRKIDFTIVLTDADEQPMSECADPARLAADDPGCKVKRSVTLGLLAMRALESFEPGTPVDEVKRRGDLGLAVYHATAYELTDADRDLIEKRIAAVLPPLYLSRAHPLLVGAPK